MTLIEGHHFTIDPGTDCWVWLLSLTRDGYGQSAHGVPAHRRSYRDAGNDLAPGQPLDHLCRNRRCINPAHLEPVTTAENNRRSRLARGIDGSRCGLGHDLTDAYVEPGTGKRKCRECRRRWARDWARRKAASAGVAS